MEKTGGARLTSNVLLLNADIDFELSQAAQDALRNSVPLTLVLRMQIVVDDAPMTVFNFNEKLLLQREIQVAPHCFGCTAGSGSSCGGSTT